MSPRALSGILVTAAGLALAGCGSRDAATGPTGKSLAATDLVWAVNVGGPAYEGIDGTQYQGEAYVTGGVVGQMETVKGSQDPVLYPKSNHGREQLGLLISQQGHGRNRIRPMAFLTLFLKDGSSSRLTTGNPTWFRGGHI